MSGLSVLDFHIVEKVLLHLGFVKVRQKGRYVFYRHQDGRTTTLPYHSGRDIARSLLREILRGIEISSAAFLEELEKI